MSKERIAALRKRVVVDPYDAQAWESLVSEADRARRGAERDAELTAVYEDLLNVFPTAAGYWREYADHQMSCSDEAVVKSVFSRCLLTCLSVDLWRSYLNFIKRLNEPRGAQGLPEIRQAYEFTLDRLGQDGGCGAIWLDYIAFLQAPKQGSSEYAAVYGESLEGQEESQKVAAVRRAYQRALLVPAPQLEALWRGYEGFEMGGSNKQLARRLLDEWRPLYQGARSLLRERDSRLSGINIKALALPPGRGGQTQAAQSAAWRDYLAWERSNPQRLDPATYAARVSLAFEQALMVLFHYPDIWLEFARWHTHGGGGGAPAAAAVLEKGRAALPSALTLHFAAADLQESMGHVAAAKAIYEELVEHLKPGGEGPAAAPQAAPAAAAQPAGLAVASSPAQRAELGAAADGTSAGEEQQSGGEAGQGVQGNGAGQGAASEQQQPKAEPVDAQAGGGTAEEVPPAPAGAPAQQLGSPEVKQGPGAEAEAQAGEQAAALRGVQLGPEEGTLAWVQYMRFLRRTEGIMAARKLFMRARRWPAMGWQAYAASAQLEWRHEAKDTIPRNIFELGLRSHLGEPGLVLAYAQFLLGLGDIPNTRALFERAVTAAAPERMAPLWDAYVAFEYDVGTLAAAAAVEQRRAEAAASLREAEAAAAAADALDGKVAGGHKAAAAEGHEAVRLALLRYRVQGLFPGDAAQRAYMERLVGGAPPAEAVEAKQRDSDSRQHERDRERDRERRHRDRSPTPPRRAGPAHAPRSPPPAAEPIRLSRELAQLLNQLPPPHALEGPVPDVDRVVAAILTADFSPDGIIAHEIAAARERRRQRRLLEQGQPLQPGGPAPGAPHGGPAGAGAGAGQKRKAHADYDSGSDSEEDERREDGGGGDGGLDVYRLRRKQQRA